ncbi:MAG: cupin-like domain-containing protein [Alphaproteobacteria bacterium]|nr:cupin-like domain-containing protein [Alphaproteobacteria bacterium]
MTALAEGLPCEVLGNSPQPQILRGLVKDWPAVTRWTPDYLELLGAGKQANVVRGNREYGNPAFESMPLAEFFRRCFTPDAGGPRLYLKEYDLLGELPQLNDDIDLNMFEFDDAQSFHDAWVGQQGARTGLHCDIFNNFLIHITGVKQIDLIPPACSAQVYPSPKFDYCARLSRVDGFEPDLDRFPDFDSAMQAAVKYTMEPGDVVYIPRRWWHQVECLSPTISLSGFVVGRSDRVPYAIERLLRRLHNLGLYKRGNCTCHE